MANTRKRRSSGKEELPKKKARAKTAAKKKAPKPTPEPPTRRNPLIAGRARGILNGVFSTKVDDQSQSPLWGKLPAEVRNQIFELALSFFDDTTKPIDQWFDNWRPEYQYASKVDLSLLLTCRRAYFEANAMPLSIATVQIYEHLWSAGGLYGDRNDDLLRRNPLLVHAMGGFSKLMHSLSNKQREQLKRVHFFVWSGRNPQLARIKTYHPFAPIQMVITLGREYFRIGGARWIDDSDAFFEPHSIRQLKENFADAKCLPPSLQVLIVELECQDRKEQRLRQLAMQVKEWEVFLKGGKQLTYANTKEMTWQGQEKVYGDWVGSSFEREWTACDVEVARFTLQWAQE
jgi:hypothetical protein